MPYPPPPAPDPNDIFDDFETDLALREANGGVGDWEERTTMTSTERWLFPRFPGATDDADFYLSRSGIGPHDSDVETLVSWLAAPRNVVGAILLIGDPGTGKTALAEAAVTHAMPDPPKPKKGAKPVAPESNLVTVVCTPDHTKDSLFLRFVGEGKGENGTPYVLGPVPYAAKHGKILYLDEAMLLVDGTKPVIYALSDGRRFLPEGNVDGSALEIHPDFRLILSSNPLVRGASLPEPLASRCASTTLTVETSKDMLLDLAIDEAVVAAWEGLGAAGLWRPAIREMRLADYWLDVDKAQAVSAFVPEHCPESQRKDVTSIVVSFLGGDIREDGRLVVS